MGQMDAAAAVVAFVYENIFSNIIRASSFFILRGLNAWNNSISISAAIRSSIPSVSYTHLTLPTIYSV